MSAVKSSPHAPALAAAPAGATSAEPVLQLPWRDPADAFAPVADAPYALLLLSGGRGSVSVIACDPERTFEGDGGEPLAEARRALAAHPPLGDGKASGLATGGLAGLLGYELGAAFEPAPRLGRSPWPDVALGLYRAAAVFDHDARRLAVHGEPNAAARLAERLGAGPAPVHRGAPTKLRARRAREAVEAAVARTVEYIRAGDIYQANISQGFDASLGEHDDPYSAFRRLAAFSPAPFSAYFRLNADRIIATHSPERFVRVARGGRVESAPIKGTRPRGRDGEEDARLAAELRASAKDRAENLMIVDLVRNDLSRVCAPGSVRAPDLFALESYANVHHLVSTVSGRLAEGKDAFDLLKAAFPAGSITGAPKVRAMEIIAELEGEPRGPYCGSIGYVGADGTADFNVMIRSIAFTRGKGGWRARFRAGAGIVADSDPHEEYEEMLTKAASIRRALGVGERPQ